MAYAPTFSTRTMDLSRNETIYVESLNAFPAPINGIITLRDNAHYIFTQTVDIGVNQLEIPNNGSILISSNNPVVNQLIYTPIDDKALFIGQILRLEIKEIDLISNGNGTCFALTAAASGNPTIFMEKGRVESFNSLGVIEGLGFQLENIAFTNNSDGIILHNNSFHNVSEVSFGNQGGDHFILTGFTFFASYRDIVATPLTGFVAFNLNSLTVIRGVVFDNRLIGTTAGGFAGLTQMINSNSTLSNIFNDITTDSNSGAIQVELPDITASVFPWGYSIKISDLGGASANHVTVVPNSNDSATIEGYNSFVIDKAGQKIEFVLIGDTWCVRTNSDRTINTGGFYVNSNTTTTAISTVDTFVDLDVVGTGFANSENFTFNTSPNEITYTGIKNIIVNVAADLTISRSLGASSRLFRIALFKNDVEIEGPSASMAIGSAINSFGFHGCVSLTNGDTLKVMIKNQQSTDDVIVTDVNLVVTEA